jgi:polysaccharide export outer membrane protein
VSQNSASGAIYVVRGSDGGDPQIFPLDVRYATGMLLAERFALQAKDVIFADTAGISQWNRVLSQLLPSVRFIGTAENLVTN